MYDIPDLRLSPCLIQKKMKNITFMTLNNYHVIIKDALSG